jgi:16S rRNA (cytosine1402-N4)-methyltransferase
MTASSDSGQAVAGGPARHIPVLVRPALELLDVRNDAIYIDATFGGGGYGAAILAAARCTVIGLDRDAQAITCGAQLVRESGGRLSLVEDRFSNLERVAKQCGVAAVDGIVFDLGVSSMQLDDPARGFSFRAEGPLDMRMGGEGPSAADVIGGASERDLAAIIATLGEERQARAVARAIVAARRQRTIVTTRALAEIVASVVPRGAGSIHPATRTFQALRILVNDELAELAAGLAAAEALLRTDGRLVVVAFHSLEDRIVKSFLSERSRRQGFSRHRPEGEQAAPTFRVLTRQPVVPDAAEIAANPRARSAKLRAAARTNAPPSPKPWRSLLPQLPVLRDVVGGQAGIARP